MGTRTKTKATTAGFPGNSRSGQAKVVLLRALGGRCECGGALTAGHLRVRLGWRWEKVVGWMRGRHRATCNVQRQVSEIHKQQLQAVCALGCVHFMGMRMGGMGTDFVLPAALSSALASPCLPLACAPIPVPVLLSARAGQQARHLLCLCNN